MAKKEMVLPAGTEGAVPHELPQMQASGKSG